MQPMPKKALHLIFVSIFIFNIALAGMALAQSTGDTVLEGFANTGKEAGFGVTGDGSAVPEREFAQAFSTYATGFAGIMGGLFMILALYAGWLWMSARGNDDQVKKAKDIILGAVIGITIVVAARIIVQLVLVALEGTLIFQQ